MTTGAAARGGRGHCTVCASPNREAIDAAITSGAVSLAKIGAQYGVSESSLKRHRHAHPAVGQLVTLETDSPEPSTAAAVGIDVAQQLRVQFDRTARAVRLAEKSGSSNAIQDAHREHRLTLEAIAKWNNEQAKIAALVAPKETINILKLPAWLQIRQALEWALQPFPEARLLVADALMKLSDPDYQAPTRLWGTTQGFTLNPKETHDRTFDPIRSEAVPDGPAEPGSPERRAVQRDPAGGIRHISVT